MKCEEPIGWRDLVPVLSYLRLRGRCRSCKAVIDWQYPVIEIVTGLLFAMAYARTFTGSGLLSFTHTEIFLLLRDFIFISYLVILFVYDLRWMYILDRFTIPAMIVAIILNLWIGVITPWSLLAGAVVLGGFFWAQYAISKGTWIGGGDIRMGVLMGLMLGLKLGLVAVFLAYLVGAVVSVGLLLVGKIDRKTPVPLGAFLTLATLVVLFVGDDLVRWYLGLFAIHLL